LVSWQLVINHFSYTSEIAYTEGSINIPTQLYKILLATTDRKLRLYQTDLMLTDSVVKFSTKNTKTV
jgi:hypothetical protein